MSPKWKPGVLPLLPGLPVKWRTFDLDTVRKQADGAFIKVTKVKDGLPKRLGAE